MTSLANNRQIPTFTLYGEEQDWPTPDLLHWESVADRSAIHNWTIKPHRHGNLWQIIYLSQGSAKVYLDDKQQSVNLPCVVIVPQLCVHGFEFSADIEGHVVTIAAPLIKNITQSLDDYQAFFQLSSVACVDKKQDSIIQSIFNNIEIEYRSNQLYRDLALQTSISQLMLWLVRNGSKSKVRNGKSHQSGQNIFNHFMQLVEAHYREHLSLDEYANALNISTPHLNSLCRQFAQRSALQLIHQRLLLEAKRNLVYTAMTASEISNTLGFSEPAYFNRFFKRLSGNTPIEFKAKQQ